MKKKYFYLLALFLLFFLVGKIFLFGFNLYSAVYTSPQMVRNATYIRYFEPKFCVKDIEEANEIIKYDDYYLKGKLLIEQKEEIELYEFIHRADGQPEYITRIFKCNFLDAKSHYSDNLSWLGRYQGKLSFEMWTDLISTVKEWKKNNQAIGELSFESLNNYHWISVSVEHSSGDWNACNTSDINFSHLKLNKKSRDLFLFNKKLFTVCTSKVGPSMVDEF